MEAAYLAGNKKSLRVIRFVLDTKEYCLKLAPVMQSEEWKLALLETVIEQAVLGLKSV
jgi:hypothetical protein